MIPIEERGYAVDRPRHLVHKRYADHAAGLPRTSYRGVMATVTDPQPCTVCWPPIETANYWCDKCERQHYAGSAVYERHRVTVQDQVEAAAQRLEGSAIAAGGLSGADAVEADRVPEPYFPRPYPED